MRRDLTIRNLENQGRPSDRYLNVGIKFASSESRKTQQVVQVVINRFNESNSNMKRSQDAGGYPLTNAAMNEMEQLKARIGILEKRLGIAPLASPGLIPFRSVTMSDPLLEVVDPPSRGVLPISPNRAVFTAFGFAFGVGLALIITIFRPRAVAGPPIPASTT